MKAIIMEKIDELTEAISDYGDNDCVSINLFFNCEGVEVKAQKRTKDNLDSAGVSMRNVKGEFVR